MSGYSYGSGDASQQNGQQYPQYNPYQFSPQAYQPNVQQQYSSIPASTSSDVSYAPMQGIIPQSAPGLDNVSTYQDFGAVYATNEASYGQPQQLHQSQQMQQHRYDVQQEAPRMQSSMLQASGYVPISQAQIPVPHLPKQSSYPANRSQNAPIPLVDRRIVPAPSNPPPPAPIPTPVPAAVHVPRQSPVTKRSKPNARRNATKKSMQRDDDMESEEDDDFSMDGVKTKSGRKVQKPSQFSPALKTGSKRRGPTAAKRPVVDSLFCKVCDRGHFSKSNLIVFCDGCNTPYHQLCHVPVIDNLLITLPDAEWFCASCDEKRGQRKLEMGHSGSNLTEEQKKSYLAGLPTSHLVQLVLHAATAHPDLGLFSPNAASILHRVHLKHEAAILEERSKLAPEVHQSGATESKVPVLPFDEGTLEGQIFRAISATSRPIRNQDIIAFIEATYVIDPQTFRPSCAAEIDRLVAAGRLTRDGSMVSLNKDSGGDPGKSIQSNAVKASATKVTNRAEKPGLARTVMPDHEGGGFINEQYPRVEGIKLPPEDPQTDGFSMQETDSPAFVHVKTFGQDS